MTVQFATKDVTITVNKCVYLETDDRFDLLLSAAPDVNGDHYCTIGFDKSASTVRWEYMYAGNIYPISGEQSFLFTSAGETYTLIATLRSEYAEAPDNERAIPIVELPYTVQAAYAPTWAHGQSSIFVILNDVGDCDFPMWYKRGNCDNNGYVVAPSQASFRSFTDIPDAIITAVTWYDCPIGTPNCGSPTLRNGSAPDGSDGLRICSLQYSPSCEFEVFNGWYASIGYSRDVSSMSITYTSVSQGPGTRTFYTYPTGGQEGMDVRETTADRSAFFSAANTEHPLDAFATGDVLLGITNTSGITTRGTGQYNTPGTHYPAFTFATAYDNLAAAVYSIQTAVLAANISFIPTPTYIDYPSVSGKVIGEVTGSVTGTISSGGWQATATYTVTYRITANTACTYTGPGASIVPNSHVLTITSIGGGTTGPGNLEASFQELDLTLTVGGRRYRIYDAVIGIQLSGGFVNGYIKYRTQSIY